MEFKNFVAGCAGIALAGSIIYGWKKERLGFNKEEYEKRKENRKENNKFFRDVIDGLFKVADATDHWLSVKDHNHRKDLEDMEREIEDAKRKLDKLKNLMEKREKIIRELEFKKMKMECEEENKKNEKSKVDIELLKKYEKLQKECEEENGRQEEAKEKLDKASKKIWI